jgi:hypothetical protein
MNTLKTLLIILGGTKLAAGYLTPSGTGTALETVISLMNNFSPFYLLQNPQASMTSWASAPNVLLCPAWIASLGAGQDAIFLSDVQGRIDASHTPKPAFLIQQPV